MGDGKWEKGRTEPSSANPGVENVTPPICLVGSHHTFEIVSEGSGPAVEKRLLCRFGFRAPKSGPRCLRNSNPDHWQCTRSNKRYVDRHSSVHAARPKPYLALKWTCIDCAKQGAREPSLFDIQAVVVETIVTTHPHPHCCLNLQFRGRPGAHCRPQH